MEVIEYNIHKYIHISVQSPENQNCCICAAFEWDVFIKDWLIYWFTDIIVLILADHSMYVYILCSV